MHKHVEGDERDKDKVHPLGQFRLLQLYGKEDSNDRDHVRQISTQPVQPVEDGPLARARMWPEECTDGLQEAQYSRDDTENGVRIANLRPASDFNKNYHNTSDCEGPRDNHQESMPLQNGTKGYQSLIFPQIRVCTSAYRKPLIFAAHLTANPGLAEVAGKKNAERSRSDPGGDHEGTVQAEQQLRRSLHRANLRQ